LPGRRQAPSRGHAFAQHALGALGQAHQWQQDQDIAELILYVVRLPRHMVLRDVVALPQGQVI
jgi:NADP-dependent 3-hydroxy acid dehydrogenase YdfG